MADYPLHSSDVCGAPSKMPPAEVLSVHASQFCEGVQVAARAFTTAHRATEDERRLGVGSSHSFFRPTGGDWALGRRELCGELVVSR